MTSRNAWLADKTTSALCEDEFQIEILVQADVEGAQRKINFPTFHFARHYLKLNIAMHFLYCNYFWWKIALCV